MIEMVFMIFISGGEATLTQDFNSLNVCREELRDWVELAHMNDIPVLKAVCENKIELNKKIKV